MAQTNIQNRQIYSQDNLDVLRAISAASIDLIYLDPPFNKKKEFVEPLKEEFIPEEEIDDDDKEIKEARLKEIREARFKDIFTEDDAKLEWALEIKERHERLYNLLRAVKDIEGGKSLNYHYLVYMAIRLIECHRILKDTGSIYLHCDPTMSHYLKLTMDYIFGERNFRNEIVWKKYSGVKNYAKKKLTTATDSIFYYAKSAKAELNPVYEQASKAYIKAEYKHEDEQGAYALLRGRNYQKTGKPKKKYLKDLRGSLVHSLWSGADVSPINTSSQERTGWPTQKPLSLLKRIIKASTKEGDMVLDPFCGCATTPVAAEILNRRWVGIDLDPRSFHLVVQRLKARPVQKELAPNKRGDSRDWDRLCSPGTEPPPRAIDPKDRRHVYIVSNPAWDGKFKVGVTGNLDTRLNDYQTSSPYRDFKYEHYRETERFFECERHIIKTFKLKPEKDDNGEPKTKGEWIVGDLERIKTAIDNFIDQGG